MLTGRKLKSVLYVIYAQAVAAGEDSDNVESQGVEVRFSVGEVVFCQAAEGVLFVWGYGFERVAEVK